MPRVQYAHWMRAGLHVVTPNKKFGAGPLARYQEVQSISQETGLCFLAEVGLAGMCSKLAYPGGEQARWYDSRTSCEVCDFI
jgi:hypothetical protein